MPRLTFPHIPHVRHGYPCPQPRVDMPIDTIHGTFRMRFILDTGAAITLIPTTLAARRGIIFPSEPAEPHDSPRTMHARLTGHLGEIETTFLDRALRIPCFFYVPPAEPPLAPGDELPDGGRRRRAIGRGPRDVEEWIDETTTGGVGLTHPCVLGRLGFMNRFHVLIEPQQTTVCSDGFLPAPRGRRWWQLWK